MFTCDIKGLIVLDSDRHYKSAFFMAGSAEMII